MASWRCNLVNIQFVTTTSRPIRQKTIIISPTNMQQRHCPPDFTEEKMQRLHLKVSASTVTDYFHLFINRRAYTLQSNRPHPESGRHYYYRPKDKKTGQGLSLTLDTIRRHLEGETTIGLYSINPTT